MAAPSPADLAAGVPASANIVGRIPAPSGKGELLVDANGGVYDTGGQSFSGSYFSLTPEQRQGQRQFTGIKAADNGGYQLQSDQPGQNYDFGPSDYVKGLPKANPLYSDPSFLAFAANAGLTYDQAAADVNRKVMASQATNTLNNGNIQAGEGDKLKGVYDNYAARGLYGAGQQAVDEGKVRADDTAQIAANNANTQNSIDDLYGGLTKVRSQALQDAATKGFDTAGTQDLTNKFNAVDARYPAIAKTGAI